MEGLANSEGAHRKEGPRNVCPTVQLTILHAVIREKLFNRIFAVEIFRPGL